MLQPEVARKLRRSLKWVESYVVAKSGSKVLSQPEPA